MPTIEVARVKRVIAHGLRSCGRRRRKAGSAIFSIFSSSFVEDPFVGGSICIVFESRMWFAPTVPFDDPFVPFATCDCFQLKLPDRRLRAEEGR